MTRYINAIWTSNPGIRVSNAALLTSFKSALKRLPLDDPDFETLHDMVRFYLIGDRSRYGAPDWDTLANFQQRAFRYETQAEKALDDLAEQIRVLHSSSGDILFDGIITTTATGHLMPGLSYRMASRLSGCLKPGAMLIDFGGAGCTGGVKALHLSRSLNAGLDNLLIVSAEFPTTLLQKNSADPDVWQGNCTFGDGAAALWVSTRPDRGTMGLRLNDLRDTCEVGAGLGMIYWGYNDYYTFKLADEKTFERNVVRVVLDALKDAEPAWRDAPHWAIHPAGITLMLRLSRKLDLSREALGPSAEHYRQFSNMSSASIFYILNDIAGSVPVQTPINLLTMGAGFNVLYGQVIKER